MSYVIGWLVLALASVGFAWLMWRSLRRFGLFASLAASLIVVWALTPIELKGGEYAPALIALLFRLFLERGADASTPATVLFFPTLVVFVVFVGVYIRRQVSRYSSHKGWSKSIKRNGKSRSSVASP
ncbi:MAG: hypothetical protein VX211_05470 [Pseudomonadota bacterium]|nr:hypothetical protein [Pseudomonadota bacterium]